MQTRSLLFAAFLLCATIPASVHGQSRDAKTEDFYANLTPYVHSDFCAAVVIHPDRIARSPIGKSIDLNKLISAALQDAELDAKQVMKLADPKKVRRLTVLIDPFPGGNVAFFPALVVEFIDETNGHEVLRALWPQCRPSPTDERLFANLESMAGTPINGYIAGPRTILIAPAPTLKKMRSKSRSPRNPLQMQLGSNFVESEIVVEYVSRPVLTKLLELTGLSEGQFRSDPETDEMMKTMLLDVRTASLHLQLRTAQSIRTRIVCNSLSGASKLKEMLNSGLEMLSAVIASEELKKELKNELKNELPAQVIELVDSAALKDLVNAIGFEQQGTAIDVNLRIPETVFALARRSAATLTNEAGRTASRPWSRVKEFEWKRKDPPVTMIHRDEGFAFLTGVQGHLPAGAEVSILPNPDGDWTLRGTDNFDLASRAVTVPRVVDVEQPVTYQLWKKGEGNLTNLIHQRDGFCALLKIGGAFNGDGEQFRLRVGEDGYWRLNARSQAPGTRVRVMVVKLKKPGSFRGVVREHHWEKGEEPIRLIHRSDGIAFLSGMSGAFAGGAEYARVRLHDDGFWYLEGRSKQRYLHAWATSIELSGME